MSVATAILFIAQSTTTAVADAPSARATPVAERVRASVRALRPARIIFQSENETETSDENQSRNVQRGRDAAGTVWVEFS